MVVLQSVRISGLNWITGRNRGVLVLRCRPSGAAAARKIALIYLGQGDTALPGPWQLEGDIKFEVGHPANVRKSWRGSGVVR